MGQHSLSLCRVKKPMDASYVYWSPASLRWGKSKEVAEVLADGAI